MATRRGSRTGPPRAAPGERGLTLVELMVAFSIAAVILGVIGSTLVVTARTTHSTSVQVDAQGQARAGLMEWERLLRDGYAVLTRFTPAGSSQEYRTDIGDDRRTVVAALPSLDENGVPCCWQGTNMVFDCVVWRAQRDGTSGLWDLDRLLFVNAFQAPLSVRGSYTVPTAFGRQSQTTPQRLFTGAAAVSVELWGGSGLIAPTAASTSPSVIHTLAPLPQQVGDDGQLTTVRLSPTDVATVRIAVECSRSADTLETGQGYTEVSNTQAVSIRLRNKQVW